MVEGEPVPVTVVPVAVITVEREIRAFPTDSARLIEGIRLLLKKAGEE